MSHDAIAIERVIEAATRIRKAEAEIVIARAAWSAKMATLSNNKRLRGKAEQAQERYHRHHLQAEDKAWEEARRDLAQAQEDVLAAALALLVQTERRAE